jgi:hypothetical protein
VCRGIRPSLARCRQRLAFAARRRSRLAVFGTVTVIAWRSTRHETSPPERVEPVLHSRAS